MVSHCVLEDGIVRVRREEGVHQRGAFSRWLDQNFCYLGSAMEGQHDEALKGWVLANCR